MQLDTLIIKQNRTDRGWSQDVLARVSGLSLRTVQRIESTGQCSAESTLALASAFEVSPTVLQSKHDTLSVNWNMRNIMSNFIALVVITLALGMLFVLAGEARIFIDWYGLGFLMSFVYAATLISFGKNGMFKSLAGLRYLFSKDIIGGKPAEYYAQVYQQQIIYSYGGAFIAFLIGSVAIHGNADLTVPDEIH